MASFQFFLYRHCLHACTNQPKCGNFLYLILTLPLQASWSWTCYYLLAWKTAPDRSINNKVGTGIIFLLLYFPVFIFPRLYMFYFFVHFISRSNLTKRAFYKYFSSGWKSIQNIQESNCWKTDMHKIIIIIQTHLFIFKIIQRFQESDLTLSGMGGGLLGPPVGNSRFLRIRTSVGPQTSL